VLAAQKQIDAGHSTLDSSTKKTGGVFSSTFGNIMPLAAAAAGAAVLKFGVDSINAFKESEAAMAQTNAVLKSTGGTANVTSQDVLNLAQRLRDMSGADDEAIQASENLLLTFTKVRNEAGKGNDIFNQGTAAILDMATSMNNGAIPSLEDLNSKTILVGKALNDPIKGLTALTRVGVSFTDGQKEQITAMVESGDTMGAQKLILAELSKEFGGAAKAAGDTFAGAQAKAQQKIEDLQEVIGGLLLPVIAEMTGAFADLLTQLAPVIEFVGRGLVVAFEAAKNEVEDIIGPIQSLLDLLPKLTDQAGESSGIWKVWGDAVGNAIQTLIENEVPGSQVFFALHDASDQATDSFKTQAGVIGDLSAFYRGRFAESMDTATERTTINENATRSLTDAQRDQRLAVLALSNSFLGIIDSARTLAEDQKELTRLTEKHKEGTKAYDDAVLQVIEDQIALEESIFSYGKELVDAGEKQRDVEKAIRDAAREAGVNKDAVHELVDEIRDYIRELNRIPENVNTHITYTKSGEGYQTGGGFQHGGVVEKTGMALVHKGEVFSGVNNEMGFGGPTVNITIGNVVGPGGVEEVADIIRRELVRTGRRNGDIFGGTA
jgi:hypothetical protein